MNSKTLDLVRKVSYMKASGCSYRQIDRILFGGGNGTRSYRLLCGR